MKVGSSSTKRFIGLNAKGRKVAVPYPMLRKPMDMQEQDSAMARPGICVVCNYQFRDIKLTWSPKVKAICHPFRGNGIALPSDKPWHLFSESDFCDPSNTPVRTSTKDYDFVSFSIDSGQGIRCKGLYMLGLLDAAAGIAGQKGLLVLYGSGGVKQTPDVTQNIQAETDALSKVRSLYSQLKNITIFKGLMSPEKVAEAFGSARYALFPNTRDASPRMLAESLLCGTPALVNENIYGGWKYIAPDTGLFFSAPAFEDTASWGGGSHFTNQLADRMKQMLLLDPNRVAPSHLSRYGFANAARSMAGIINATFGTSYRMVCYDEHLKLLEAMK